MRFKRIMGYIIIISLLCLLAYYKTDIQGNAIKNYEREPAHVLRVIDGDTIEVNLSRNKETIRLLGINNKIV